MTEYDECWVSTYTGKHFHFLNPSEDEVDIKDIAHHLSLLCRFTGACREFYSVAQHSVLVAECVPSELKLPALLHDAAEAYTNDISRPIKLTHKLDQTENKIVDVINRKFKVNTRHAWVRYYDDILCATEARDLMRSVAGWARLPSPLEEHIYPWSAKDAEDSFLDCFVIYGGSL